jgi:hypothetical protein
MKFILFQIFILLSFVALSQDCHRAYWVDGYDGTQAFEHFIDIDRHPAGGFVVCGKHSADGTTLGNQTINTGAHGYYLAHMDSAGNFSQLTSLFSQDGIALKRITVLPDGSVAAGCTVNSNITLGSETFHIHGGAKPLLIKFDNQFNYDWHRASENTSNSSEMRDISCDSEGNIYWGGLFSGNDLSFGGTFHLHRTTDGGAWLSKINAQGQIQWLRGIAPGVSAGLQTVTVDSNNDIWISGQASIGLNNVLKFSDQIIAPGYLNSAWTTYVAKFDNTGTCLWGKVSSNTSTFGSIYTTDAMADDNGNMYICGQFTGTFEWYGMPMLGGDGSGYLWKLDTEGNGQWIKTMGGQGSSESAVALDVRGDRIAVIGYLSSNQPYVGNFPAYSLPTSSYKAFNAQFYSNGELEFCRTNQNDTQNFMQHDVVIDEGFNQIVFGYYKGNNVSWYPLTLTHAGVNPKMFVAKYGPAATTSFSISAGPDKTTTCGTNVQLSGSTTPSNGVGFGWWPDLGFSNNYSKTPGVNLSMPNEYIFYGYYQGCVIKDTVQVILTNHSLTVDAGEDAHYCLGDTTQLVAICNDPAATMAWTPNYRLSTTNTLTTNCFTNTSLNYVVEATLGNCKARDTVFVLVHRKPAITIPYQQYYQSYQMHTCIDLPIFADLGTSENTYSFNDESHITWQNDHSVIFNTDAPYYGGTLSALSPEGCTNQIIYTVNVYDNQLSPPILNQPNDTIYLCPAGGYVYEEEFMITTDIQYLPEEFNFSWYSGWQVDSLDGLGWRDIDYWNYGHYELFPNSVGNPTSAYYVPLRFWNVEPSMDGFKYRAYIHDICSPRAYTDQMVLRVGPAFIEQTTAITICEGATDTLFVEASNNNGAYQWQVFRDHVWTDLLSEETHFNINNNQLIILNATAGMDSLFRCRIVGCSPQIYSYSDSILVTVQSSNFSVLGPFQSIGCLGDSIALHVEVSGGNFDAQWLKDGVPLDLSSVGHSGTNDDTLWIATELFNPIGHVYSCHLFNTQCSQTFTSSELSIELSIPTNISWALSDNALCVNDPPMAYASASPSGGIYTSSIIDGDFVNPQNQLPGTYNIQYAYIDISTGCTSEAIQNISISPLPAIELTLSADSLCINSPLQTIDATASPIGGAFEFGLLPFVVNGNSFELPTTSGSYPIQYQYTDTQGCSNSISTLFIAKDTISIDWVEDLGTFCAQNKVNLIDLPSPAGGQFAPYQITDNALTTAGLIEGAYVLRYQYTAPNGCISSKSSPFIIQDVSIIWTDSLLAACSSSGPIPAGDPQPAGGIFTGPGVTLEGLFNPTFVGEGFHPINYFYTDPITGCSATATQYIQVYNQPQLTFSLSDHDLCAEQGPHPLNEGQPSGGSYSGPNVAEPNSGVFVLQPTLLGLGEYEVTYTYTDNFGCSASITDSYAIHPLPELSWIDNLGSFCTNDQLVEVEQPTPLGGDFLPNYASSGQINVTGLLPDEYIVQYLYTDEFGCSSFINATFAINDTVTLSWTALQPELPNEGFYFCGNFESNWQADLTSWASPGGGNFYLGADLLEENTWFWGAFFEPNSYDLSYTITNPATNCVSQSVQSFDLELCASVQDEHTALPRCWSDNGTNIWLNSTDTGRFEIYSSSGQLVYEGNLTSHLQLVQIDLAQGIYQIVMTSGRRTHHQKLILGL